MADFLSKRWQALCFFCAQNDVYKNTAIFIADFYTEHWVADAVGRHKKLSAVFALATKNVT